MEKKTQMHDVERGELLRYLSEMYPRSTTPRMLINHLDDMGYSVDEETLVFHIHYLSEGGYLQFELFDRIAGQPERIRIVKIQKAGIDAVDRRRAGETGVRF